MDDSFDREFQELSKAPTAIPHARVSHAILSLVEKELNPSASDVLVRVFALALLSGAVSLIFCPQFQIGLGHHSPIMTIFAQFGELACHAACGVFYGAASLLAVVVFLRPEELRVLRQTRFLQLAGYCALSLGLFICAGPAAFASSALLWAAGSFVAGIATLELGWALRMRRL